MNMDVEREGGYSGLTGRGLSLALYLGGYGDLVSRLSHILRTDKPSHPDS